MKEARKKLTDVQLKYLKDTQETLTKARTAHVEAEQAAQRVLTLIFDALGLAQDAQVRLDEDTGELVVMEAADAPAA